MTPINFTGATHTLQGPPGSDIGDLPVASVQPHILSVWTFTPEERAAVAAGKNLMLSIMARGMPPAALTIAPDCCPQCGGEVKPGTEIVTNNHGDSFHKLCWDIAVAALESDLSAALRDNPDYVEIRPGVFDRTADSKAREESIRRDDRAALDAIGRAVFFAPDDATNFDPAAVLEAVKRLIIRAAGNVARAVADEVISERGGVERPA